MGQITHVGEQLGEVRKRDFRRMLVGSALAHVLVLVVFTQDFGSQQVLLPGVVSVDLVSLPSTGPAAPAAEPEPAPAPAPVPEPEPAPEPEPIPEEPLPPPKPVAKKVVLPKEAREPKPKPKAKPKPKPVEKKPPQKPAEEDYDDVMAKLRADAGENTPKPALSRNAPASRGSSGGGLGTPVSPEVAAWLKKAKIHVRRAWVLPPAFRTQQLEAHVLVDLDAGGNVVGTPRIVKRSGNPWFDEGVVRAIQGSSPLPPPPEADEWSFVFVPGDSY